jgi:ribose transport system permease protein
LESIKRKSIFYTIITKFLRNSQATLIIGIVILSSVIALHNPIFFHIKNLLNIGISVAVSGIMVTGLTLAMLSGSMDISQYALGAFSAMLVAILTESKGLPVGVSLLFVIIISIICGLFNGIAITKMKIFPMIATLGTSFIFRSFAYIITDSKSIMVHNAFLITIAQKSILGVPNVITIMFISFALIYFVLKYMPFGRQIFAVGGNAVASHLSGIRIDRIKIYTMVICAVTATIGGILNAYQVGVAIPTQGNGADLDNVVAVVLGGVSIAGGGGRIIGTLLGVIFMGILKNGLTLMNVQSYYQILVRGIVLILAVYLDFIRSKFKEK